MKRHLVLPLASFVLLLSGSIAHAATLYSNPVDLSNTQGGDCEFNSTCGNTSDTFVAQKFTLASSSTITGGGFNTILIGGAPGDSVDYIFYGVDSGTGLPGAEIAFGSSSLSATAGPTGNCCTTEDYSFTVSSFTLAAGSYYIAVHEDTSTFGDNLSFGTSPTGGAESSDGGVTYFPGFNRARSAAISVDGTTGVAPVPEPGSLCLLGTGLAGMAALRRRFARR